MSRLKKLAINEEGFIFDPGTGESFTVNSTGLAIMKGLRESKSQEEIAAALMNSFDVSQDEAECDTADFVARLQNYKIV